MSDVVISICVVLIVVVVVALGAAYRRRVRRNTTSIVIVNSTHGFVVGDYADINGEIVKITNISDHAMTIRRVNHLKRNENDEEGREIVRGGH